MLHPVAVAYYYKNMNISLAKFDDMESEVADEYICIYFFSSTFGGPVLNEEQSRSD